MRKAVHNDLELLELIKSDADRGLKALMDQYSGFVYHIVRERLKGKEQDIEECVADVFTEFFYGIDKVDTDRGSIKAYLATMAARKSVDSSRTGATHFVFSYDEIGRSDSYELHFSLISMIKDEEVTIELGDKTPGETVEAYGREVKGQSSDLIKVEKVELIPIRDIIDPQYDWDSYTIYADSGFDKEVVDIAKIKTAGGADKQTTLTYFRNASFDGREIDGITNMVNSSPDDIPDQWTEVPLGEKLEDVHTITLKNAVYDLRYDFTFNLSR